MYIWFFLVVGFALYIFFDASKRTSKARTPFLWLVAVLFFPYITIPLYFIIGRTNVIGVDKSTRLPLKTVICPKCGKENSIEDNACSKCNNNLQL
jgi:hypothetical protein